MQIYDNVENKSISDNINGSWESVMTGSNGFTLLLNRDNYGSDSDFLDEITRFENLIHLVINDGDDRYTIITNDKEFKDVYITKLGLDCDGTPRVNGCCVISLTLK